MKKVWLAALLVALAGVLLYAQTLAFGFLAWDDDRNILHNPWLKAGDWLHFWTSAYYGLYIPIPYTVWTLIAGVSQNPASFHAANLLVHAANSALVAILTARLLADAPAGTGRRRAWLAALAAGMLFAAHPLQSETVAWISGFRDLACTFSALLAVLGYVVAPPGRSAVAFAAFAAFVASILCKPAAGALPVALALIDVYLRRRPWRTTALRLCPWFLVSLLAAYATSQIQAETIAPQDAALSLVERCGVALDALGFTFLKIVLPLAQAVDYGRIPQVILSDPSRLYMAAGAALLLGTMAMAWTIRGGLALSGALVALALFAPTSGLAPFAFQRISTVSDRYAYLPMIGVALIAAGGLRLMPTRGGLLVLGAALPFLGFLTATRTKVWRDDEALFQAMLDANPHSFSAHGGLGTLAMHVGHDQDALQHYEAALAEQPHNVLALANVGLALDHLGRYDEVLRRIAPEIPGDELIRRSPLSAEGIGRMLEVIGYAYVQTGQVDAGLGSYCRAASIAPSTPDLAANLAMLMRRVKSEGLALPAPCQGQSLP